MDTKGMTVRPARLRTAAPWGTATAVPMAAMTPSRIEVRRPSLEDIFVKIVAGEEASATDDGARLRASLRDPKGAVEVQS